MPNPTKRHSRTRRNMRRAHDFLAPVQASACPQCGKFKLPPMSVRIVEPIKVGPSSRWKILADPLSVEAGPCNNAALFCTLSFFKDISRRSNHFIGGRGDSGDLAAEQRLDSEEKVRGGTTGDAGRKSSRNYCRAIGCHSESVYPRRSLFDDLGLILLIWRNCCWEMKTP